MTSTDLVSRLTARTLLACALLGGGAVGCGAADDELDDGEDSASEESGLTVTGKGARISDEGGAKACGSGRIGAIAQLVDGLPFAAQSDIYRKVTIALVSRSSGSVTDWNQNPIRIEVANYGSCETVKLVVIHELGHAFRALYLGSGEFPASGTSGAAAAQRRNQWANYFGSASWDAIGPRAQSSCGASASHCALATDELFAETFRGAFYRYQGGGANVWCKGSTPCWIYNYYGSFSNPLHVGGYREWLAGLTGGGAPPPPPPQPHNPIVPQAPSGCGVLHAGQGLTPGQTLKSCDGRFSLVQQSDGNLVLYKPGKALWASGTTGKGGYTAIMQGDGNFVVYTGNRTAIWSSKTHGNTNAKLALQNDGNLVVYSAGGTPKWASGTHGN